MMTRLMSFLLLAGCTSLASQAVNPKSSDTPALQVSTSQLKNSRFHIVLDYHYNLGLSQRIGSQTQGRNETYRMGGNSLHLTALYDFTEKFSAGAGIGADGIQIQISIRSRSMPPSATVRFPAFRLLMFTPMQDTVCSNLSTSTPDGWATWVSAISICSASISD